LVSRGLLNPRPHPSACGPSGVLWQPPSSGRSRLGSVVAAASMAPAVGRAGSSARSRAAAAAAAAAAAGAGWARQGATAPRPPPVAQACRASRCVWVLSFMGCLHLHGASQLACGALGHASAHVGACTAHAGAQGPSKIAPRGGTAAQSIRARCLT